MKERQYYECANCANRCLSEPNKKPGNNCACGNADWKLMKNQQAWIVGEEDYIEPKGEI